MDPGATGSPEQKFARLEEALRVSEAQAGDAVAFVRLLNRHERPLLYYLRRLVPNADDALDWATFNCPVRFGATSSARGTNNLSDPWTA